MKLRIVALILLVVMLLTSVSLAENTYPLFDEPITVKGLLVGTADMTYPRICWEELGKLTGIKFEFTQISKEQLPMWLASPKWDVDFIHTQLTSTQVYDYGVLGGKFINIRDYLEYMPYLTECMEEYPVMSKAVAMFNGAMYDFPAIDRSQTSVTARIHYRKDILDQYDLAEPTTLDELYNTMKVLYEKTGNSPIADLQYYVGSALYTSFGPYNNYDFDELGDGQLVYGYTTEQYRHYLAFLNKLYEEHLLHEEYLTMDNATKNALLREGKLVFGYQGFQNLTNNDFASGNIEIGALKPLSSEWAEDPKFYNYSAFANHGGLFICSDSKYAVELCQAIDVAYAKSEVKEGTGMYGVAFVYGPENMTWRWTNEEHSEYEYILPEDFTGSMNSFQSQRIKYANFGRYDVFAHAFPNSYDNNRVRQESYAANVTPYTAELLVPYRILAFTEEEQAAIDNYYVEISSYVTSMTDKFITGVEDIDDDATWAAYCNNIDSMHIEDVLNSYQQSYDRWLAN